MTGGHSGRAVILGELAGVRGGWSEGSSLRAIRFDSGSRRSEGPSSRAFRIWPSPGGPRSGQGDRVRWRFTARAGAGRSGEMRFARKVALLDQRPADPMRFARKVGVFDRLGFFARGLVSSDRLFLPGGVSAFSGPAACCRRSLAPGEDLL